MPGCKCRLTGKNTRDVPPPPRPNTHQVLVQGAKGRKHGVAMLGQARVRTRGEGWYDAVGVFWSAAGGANWPIATYCPLPLDHYLHRRRCPSASHRPLTFLSLLGPTLPLYFPFLSIGRFVPTEPPDCPCFTAPCRVHTEEGNFPRRWPAASKWTPPSRRWGTSPTAAFDASFERGGPLV